MGLLSVFRRRDAHAPDPSGAAADEVAQARSRARRRLIGATVLLGLGVIAFPLLLETQPRPIALDIPIEIPRKDNAPPLAAPPARLPGPTVGAAAGPPVEPTRAASSPVVLTESAAEQGREVAPAASSPGAVPAASVPPRTPPLAPRPASAAMAPPARAQEDGARAQALLEGATKPASTAADAGGAARHVVQVGAYTDAATLDKTRQKVEKLGLKTYVQVVEADGHKRTRIRVGPFASRDEALAASGKLKAAGLPGAVLTLAP